jgi:hypothetical protein
MFASAGLVGKSREFPKIPPPLELVWWHSFRSALRVKPFENVTLGLSVETFEM